MTETPTSEGAATQAKGQSRGRTAAMWALLVVAGLLLLLTSFAIWVNRVALNTDAFTATSSELLADDAIRGAVATRAVDQLYEAVDVQAEVEDQLPDDLKSLSGPAAAGLRQLSYEVVDRALEQPRLQSLFATAIEQAHKTLVNVLSGGGTVTDTSGGIVSLDLSQIVLEAADRIGIRSQVEDKLPESVGKVEILRSDQLNTAQNGFELLKTLAWVLPFLTLVAIGLAVWVAKDRRRAVRGAGIVILVIGILGLIASRLTGTYLVDSLVADTETRTAAENTWSILTDALRSAFRSLTLLGILIIVAAALAGPARWALGARKWLAPALRNRLWGYLALTAVVLILLAASATLDFARFVFILLVLLLGAAFIETMRTKALHEFPDAAMPAFVGETRERIGAWWGQARDAISAPRQTAEPTDVASRLANLAELHARGELSDEEYAAAKAKVLAGS